jgi:hypothetical protein
MILTHFRPSFQNQIFFSNCPRQFSSVFLKRKTSNKIFISGTVLYRWALMGLQKKNQLNLYLIQQPFAHDLLV